MWRSLAQMRTTANICYSNIYELCMANCAMEKRFARFPQFDPSHAPRLEAMRICSRSQHCSHCSVCFNAGTAMRNPTIGHVGNSIWGLLELADRTRKEMLLNIEYPWISLNILDISGNLRKFKLHKFRCRRSFRSFSDIVQERRRSEVEQKVSLAVEIGWDWAVKVDYDVYIYMSIMIII